MWNWRLVAATLAHGRVGVVMGVVAAETGAGVAVLPATDLHMMTTALSAGSGQ